MRGSLQSYAIVDRGHVDNYVSTKQLEFVEDISAMLAVSI